MQRLPRLSIALVSATVLAYEVLLMRLYSINQWHHFAYMIISIALLGYGASGTFLSLWRRPLLKGFNTAFIGNIVLFALSAPGCFLIAQQLPFNPQEVLWDLRQPLWLLASYLLLTLPFFFAANSIGLALSRFPREGPRLYAFDLFGAGIGSMAIIGLLFAFTAQTALLLLAGGIFCAAAIAWLELQQRPRPIALAFILLGTVVFGLPDSWLQPVMSPYKGQQQLLQISGTRIIDQRSSPLGLLSVVESRKIPLRHAPGLSLMATQEPPRQLAVFTDGEGMTALNHATENPEELAYLDQMTSALPYHLNRLDKILILGAGGGADILQARYHGQTAIDAVELNPQMIQLQRDYADFTGDLFASPDTHLHIAEGRGFISQSRQPYDLIQIALLDSFSASSAGLYALSETYLYTIEAMAEYIRHLSPSGMLAISRWVKLPPRDTLKLFATAVAALERLGVDDPGTQLVLIRSWQTSTLVIKRDGFTPADIATLKRFCTQRAFDLVHYPGIKAHEVNRYNILRQPLFYQGAQALLGNDKSAFTTEYKYRLEPATDDKPYFFHFFKWRSLGEIIEQLGRGGMPLLEVGYLLLVATLLQALLASLLLILLPLWIGHRQTHSDVRAAEQARAMLYFFSLGLAFLFIEIACMQKFILFLHHPLYAISVVLAAFLIFAGLGSAFSTRFVDSSTSHRAIYAAVAGIVFLGAAYLFLLSPLFATLLPVSYALKIALSVLLIAPLAFCMGIPFPLGIARLGQSTPQLIPWVWGVNGCASVLSAISAMLLAIHYGFSVVIGLALLLYIIAAASVPGRKGQVSAAHE